MMILHILDLVSQFSSMLLKFCPLLPKHGYSKRAEAVFFKSTLLNVIDSVKRGLTAFLDSQLW